MSYTPFTEDPLSNAVVTPLNDLSVSNRKTLIELKSMYKLSTTRDNVITSGSSTVTNAVNDREYRLTVSGSTSSATLRSKERGRYVSGKSAEYGMGVRLDSNTYSGDTVSRWGGINDTNGLYFGQDSTGKFVAVLDDGTENKIYQADWNVDKLDGTGESGYNLDTTDGAIYDILFTWYGYGIIKYIIYIKTIEGLKRVTVHNYIVDGKTSIKNPNLPLAASIENSSSTDTHSVFVGGRQFSIVGSYSPTFRITSEFRTGQTVGTASVIPLISFRRKTIENFENFNVKLDSFDIITDNNLIAEIYVDGVLTGDSWVTPTRTLSGETALEVDKSATAINVSNASIRYRKLIFGGSGNNSVSFDEVQLERLLFELPEGSTFTLAAIATTTSATVTSVLRMREEW